MNTECTVATRILACCWHGGKEASW